MLELIGNTPLVEVTRLDTGRCRLFLKLENQNPGGSIKDRIALAMVEAAEKEKRISPGNLLVEATAGNTGLALALVAVRKGYRLLIVVPDKMSQEKIFHLRAMGAEVRMTRSDATKGHPEYYQDLAARIAAETPGAYYVNQFANPANPDAYAEKVLNLVGRARQLDERCLQPPSPRRERIGEVQGDGRKRQAGRSQRHREYHHHPEITRQAGARPAPA